MKYIYLVRHGESESNASAAFRGSNSNLTEKGKIQAGRIAERCENLPVEVVISSTLNRAKQTAEIINKKLNKPIDETPLCVEMKMPSYPGNIEMEDWNKIIDALYKNFSVPGYRYSDEENFDDLNKRAGEFLEYLEKRPESHVLAVTHGTFNRMLVGKVLFGDQFDAKIGQSLLGGLRAHNTGLTILRMTDKPNEWGRTWSIMTWNDYAHLGDTSN